MKSRRLTILFAVAVLSFAAEKTRQLTRDEGEPSLQRPRIFYRRETELQTLVIASTSN